MKWIIVASDSDTYAAKVPNGLLFHVDEGANIGLTHVPCTPTQADTFLAENEVKNEN